MSTPPLPRPRAEPLVPQPDPTLARAARLAQRLTGAPAAVAVLVDAAGWVVALGTAGEAAGLAGEAARIALGGAPERRPADGVHDGWLGVPTGGVRDDALRGAVCVALGAGAEAVAEAVAETVAERFVEALDDVAALVADAARDAAERAALRGAAERATTLLDSLDAIVWEMDPATYTFTFVSRRAESLFGYPLARWYEGGDFWVGLLHPDDREAVLRACADGIARGVDHEIRYRMLAADGRVLWIDDFASVVVDATGRTVQTRGVMLDVTARVDAEAARTRLTQIIEATPDFVGMSAPDTRVRYLNPAARRMLGIAPDHPLDGLLIRDLHPPAVFERLMTEARPAAMRDGSWAGESVIRPFDGSPDVPVSQVIIAHRDADGTVSHTSTIIRDQRERKATEEALRTSEERYRLLAESVRDVVGLHAVDGRLLYVSPSCIELLGYTPAELEGRDPFAYVHPEDAERMRASLENLLAGAPPRLVVYRYRARDGSYRWMETLSQPLVGERGAVDRVLTSSRDVTERVVAERALRRSDERHRLVARATTDVIYDWAIDDDVLEWGDAPGTVFGHAAVAVGRGIAWWQEQVHPEDRGRVQASLAATLAGDGDTWTEEYRFRRGDGGWSVILERGGIVRAADGRAVRMVGAMSDVTERRQLEQRLRQAQKMEAVGRLAGGVAHDFNNVLTAIRSYGELLLDDIGRDPALAHLAPDVEEIRRAVDRATALTRQLLAFSRKQVVRPRALDAAAVLAALQPMLRRLTPESIALDVALPGRPAPVFADAGQLEQIALNLCVNAHDAMPGGGTLRVELHDRVARDGRDWVALVVRDTGVGMNEATRARIFEPFFTTKPQGKGTGLGLATVYGIVQQAHGLLDVESTLGVGTAFTVLLPRLENRAPLREPGRESGRGRALRAGDDATAPAARIADPGSRTILLVEDEDAVRTSLRRILERQGCRVLEASNGIEALRLVAAHHEPIHLMLTDVVMPEMGGRELAEWIAGARPETRIVFMSGYTGGVRVRGGAAFVQKPFSAAEVVRVVSEVLARPS